ncbi:MAG TPA: transposase [Terriglobales bacterium]|nr:transposase [Terriglobales bacterium]
MPGPGLLAQVAVSKYGDHLPLNRMESIFQRHGVELSRKTMCGWMAACAELVSPVWEAALYVIDAPVSFHWEGTPMLFDRLWHSVSLLFPAVACLAAAAITARLQRSSGASPHAVPQSAP